MASDSTYEIRLIADALGDTQVNVRGLVGREALSEPFVLDLELAVVDGDLDLGALVGNPITVGFFREGSEQRRISGVVASADDLLATDASGALAGYALRVVPRLHLLSLNERLAVYLDKSVPEIVAAVLEAAGLVADQDFVLGLDHHYPKREFVVQYRESDLAFISRLTEQVGITYNIVEEDGRDVVHFADADVGDDVKTPLQHDPRREGFGVFSIRRSVRALPSRVRLDDYDYNKPLLGLVANSPVAGGIGGEVYEYGPNYATPDEGRHLAEVRAAEIGARRDVYTCASTEPSLFAGARVVVEGTPRGDLALLVTELETRFEVREPADFEEGEAGPVLENTFHAIPRGVQFRPERRTPQPRVHGMLTGVIDAEVRDEYASLDDHGRYRVKLLFDASGPKEGHASLPIRMAQSHAGPGYGMHFPLRPGVEVLIAFVNGDPDRPVIAGCVPNVLTPSPVTRANGKRNVIRTGSNNEINIDDQQGGERIKLSTPRHNTVFQMGAANAPEEGIHLATEANFTSITKTGSALVSGGNSLLSAKHAFIGGDVISLAGKTVPERVKAIMEMGEAVTELLAEVAGVIGDTTTQPTLAVLSAEVEKSKGEVEDDEEALAEAENATPRDEEKIDKAREALKEKKERLAKLEEVEERVEQATEAAKSAVELVAGGVTDVTKLVSLVCDVFTEIERIKALGEVSGLFAASMGNTLLAGGKPDLGLKMERPYNLVASDKVAAVAGEDIGFFYGKDATVFGGETATFTSEQTVVAGIKNVEITSRDKIWLHTTPASVQLLPEVGITLQSSPGNAILLTPEGELNVTAEGDVEIASGGFAVEAGAANIAVETTELMMVANGAVLSYAENTFVKTDASGVTLQPVAGSLLNFAPAGTLTVTAGAAITATATAAMTVTAGAAITVTTAGYTLVNSATTTIGGTEIFIG